MPDYVSKDFVKHHLPCPKCGGSDPVSMHEDRSAYCFSCSTTMKDYDKECDAPLSVSKPVDIQPYRNNAMNNAEGEFLALTDRGISLDSAKKYGVKAVKDSKGQRITVEEQIIYCILNEEELICTNFKTEELVCTNFQ